MRVLITHLEFPFLVHHAGKMRSKSRWPGDLQAALCPQETRSRLIVWCYLYAKLDSGFALTTPNGNAWNNADKFPASCGTGSSSQSQEALFGDPWPRGFKEDAWPPKFGWIHCCQVLDGKTWEDQVLGPMSLWSSKPWRVQVLGSMSLWSSKPWRGQVLGSMS